MPSSHSLGSIKKRAREEGETQDSHGVATHYGSTKAQSTSPPVDMKTFLINNLFLFLIQDDDQLAISTIQKNFARDVREFNNGTPTNLAGLEKAITKVRREVRNRRQVSQDVLFVPADEDGLTGSSAHSFKISGIDVDTGKDVLIDGVSVLKVGLIGGKRMVELESFVILVK